MWKGHYKSPIEHVQGEEEPNSDRIQKYCWMVEEREGVKEWGRCVEKISQNFTEMREKIKQSSTRPNAHIPVKVHGFIDLSLFHLLSFHKKSCPCFSITFCSSDWQNLPVPVLGNLHEVGLALKLIEQMFQSYFVKIRQSFLSAERV